MISSALRGSRGWHLLGVLFVLIGLVLGCVVAPVGGDAPIHHLANFASKRFNDIYLTIGILTLIILSWRGRSRAEFIRLLSVMLTVTLVVQIIQKTSFYVFHLWARPSGGDGGFPSGHAAASCALAYLLTERLPWGAPLWYAAAALITWSRVEAGAHYPYQIVCGAILGLGTAYTLSGRNNKTEKAEAAPVSASTMSE